MSGILELCRGTVLYGGRLYTLNNSPGWRLRGQPLLQIDGREYRSWNPYSSKLAAYIMSGGRELHFTDGNILYLGASHGTTVSHLADISEGIIYAVEISPPSYSALKRVAANHTNIVPVLGDASRPDEYALYVEDVRTIIQDIARQDMDAIFLKNAALFEGASFLYLSIKTASIDSTRSPHEIAAYVREKIEGRLQCSCELTDISKYEKGHWMLFIRR